MNFLAIDTVFDKCGIAIIVNDEVIYQTEKTGKRQQTQQILPMIDESLSLSGLKLTDFQALVFNRGPGAFSGIRINTAVVQALSFAHDIPCVGVSSLQILAQAGFDKYGIDHVYALLDARMKQVYLGEYHLKEGIMTLVGDERLLDYDNMTDKNLPLCCLATDDKDLLALYDHQECHQTIEPNARVLAKLGASLFAEGAGVPAEQALPVYLRNNAWKTLKEQGKGRG